MKVETRRLLAKWVLSLLFIALTTAVVVFATGCSSTVAPAAVVARAIAFDGAEQNAGVLKGWPGKGALITDAKKTEYDALVAFYKHGSVGHPFVPPLVEGRGLTLLRGRDQGYPLHEVVWLIDAQALTDFILIKAWQRAGRTPL